MFKRLMAYLNRRRMEKWQLRHALLRGEIRELNRLPLLNCMEIMHRAGKLEKAEVMIAILKSREVLQKMTSTAEK